MNSSWVTSLNVIRDLGKFSYFYAPINGLPQDGGAGQPTGNLTFSGFQMSISLPLGLHCKSNSHPWGPQTFIIS